MNRHRALRIQLLPLLLLVATANNPYVRKSKRKQRTNQQTPSIDHDAFGYFEQADDDGDTVLLQFSPTGTEEVLEVPNVPRYFMQLGPSAVAGEVAHFLETKMWRESVSLMAVRCGLKFESSGFPEEDADLFYEIVDGWSDVDVCRWEGIACNSNGNANSIRWDAIGYTGTISTWIGSLRSMQTIMLGENELKGTIPEEIGELNNLQTLVLRNNKLSGTIPESLLDLQKIKTIDISRNKIGGTVPNLSTMPTLTSFDASFNSIVGTISNDYGPASKRLKHLNFQDNSITGTLPKQMRMMENIETIDLSNNYFSGSIPRSWMRLEFVKEIRLGGNRLQGSIPSSIVKLSKLRVFDVSHNKIAGIIPRGDDILPGIGRIRTDAPSGGKWADMTELRSFQIDDNNIQGTIPPEFFFGLGSCVEQLGLSHNELTGTIPAQVGSLSVLKILDLSSNQLTGRLPIQLNQLSSLTSANLTANVLTGIVPDRFCLRVAKEDSLLYKRFGCHSVLCPPLHFHPLGAATLQSSCRRCPTPKSEVERTDNETDTVLQKVLGRTSCEGVSFKYGDLNGDGKLSDREILNLLYVNNAGEEWGTSFKEWANLKTPSAELYGVLTMYGSIVQIDLSEAAVCGVSGRDSDDAKDCLGLPAEIAQISNLEVIILKKRQFMQGTIPTELGAMSRLRYLDMSGCQSMKGNIPSELSKVSTLRYLSFAGCRLSGSVPSELFAMTGLEKLHLSTNPLSGSIPTSIQTMTHLKELMLSRMRLTGNIPSQIGHMMSLENLELYGNQLTGSIPSTLYRCANLKRVDLFNNDLVGSIPNSLATLQSLQILHLKMNKLTGTIPFSFGHLPFLSWFDISANRIHGTIPASFSSSQSLKDFRLGGNMIYDPIPSTLCTNTNINSGLTRMYGCDGVICPLGTYSDSGHATHSDGCKPCEAGFTTMYLGSHECIKLTEEDILAIYYEVIELKSEQQTDPDKSVCEWNGIDCNENDEIETMRFPMYAAEGEWD